MIRFAATALGAASLLLAAFATDLIAQQPPYDVFPPADPPYYRVRYAASAQKGELVYPVNYTLWVPKDVKVLRGVIVHQHGCGEGSCKSGLTGAYDLHWQALAKKHDCALLSPSYEQPDKAECQMWCDPRNGSGAAFQKGLADLGAQSGHPELPKIPWALWGHSGGGHWAGGIVLVHPERVVAAWLRSGVPAFKADPKRAAIKPHIVSDAALNVPIMCNLGTKEGVTVKEERFAAVWPANEAFFGEVRGKGGLVGVAVDPLSSHECGNQRYLAIPWLDACLSARLPKIGGAPLQPMPTAQAWLAPITGSEAAPAAKFAGDPHAVGWLPNEAIAKAWMQYVKDTTVVDLSPPPIPTKVRLKGNELTWEADADLESGLASFLIERDGKVLVQVPEQPKNPFGRPLFQNLQYSDTPPQPLAPMRYTDTTAEPGKKHIYRVIAVNTANLKSMPSEAAETQLPPMPKGFDTMRENIARGKIETVEYDSKTTGDKRKMVVYTPPGYAKDRTYPVLYLLHGAKYNETSWTKDGGAHIILDNLLADKKIVPMVVVMPNGHVPATAGQGEVKGFESELLNDVMPAVESRYAIQKDRNRRALAGFSMGGGQSVPIGLKRLETFAWLAGFSPALQGKANLVPKADDAKRIRLFYLACGDADPFFTPVNTYHASLEKANVPHVWNVFPGGQHNLTVWKNDLYQFSQLVFKDSGE
jgi:enterochelin esterase-like enzyme